MSHPNFYLNHSAQPETLKDPYQLQTLYFQILPSENTETIKGISHLCTSVNHFPSNKLSNEHIIDLVFSAIKLIICNVTDIAI